MKEVKNSIVLIIFVVLILCSCNLIKKSLATEQNVLLYEQSATVYEKLSAAETLEAFWQIIMAEENKEAVMAFTADEISDLTEKVNTLYNSIENPTADDTDYKDMLMETFSILPNGGEELDGEPEVLALASGTTNITANTTISTTTLEGNATWNISANVTVKLTGQINTNGFTLTIKGKNKDTSIIKATANISNWMFNIKSGSGGALSMENVTVDGGLFGLVRMM